MTTIARLSAVVTTDTAGFQQGMARAGQTVKKFGDDGAKSGNLTTRLGAAVLTSSRSFGRFSSIIGPIAGAGGPVALLGLGLAAIAVGAAAAAAKLAIMGDAARDAKLEAARDLGKAQAESRGETFVDNSGLKTSKELIDEIKQAMSDFAEMSGLSFNSILAGVAETIRGLNILWYGEAAVEAQDRRNKQMADEIKQAKELKAETAQRNAEEQKAIADIQRSMEQAVDGMRSKADAMAQSLRTPAEKFRDSLKEIDQLRSGLFINDEIFTRGIARASSDYQEAAKKLMDAKSVPGVSALERGSVAEVSFRLSSIALEKERDKTAKEQLATEKEIRDEVKKLNNKPAATTIKIGSLT